MKAVELFRTKELYGRGIIEIVIWQLPQPVPPSEHPYKYRMVYIIDGQRVIGFDNERGKGDHRHLGEVEAPYRFISPQQLVADFWKAVEGVSNG